MEEHDKLNKFIKILEDETDDFVGGLLETIERIATGNPRLNKKEREMFGRFFSNLVGQMAATIRAMQSINELRMNYVLIHEKSKRTDALRDEGDKLLCDVLKQIIDMLEHDRSDIALERLKHLVNGLNRFK